MLTLLWLVAGFSTAERLCGCFRASNLVKYIFVPNSQPSVVNIVQAGSALHAIAAAVVLLVG
jgi:hypothetical protein